VLCVVSLRSAPAPLIVQQMQKRKAEKEQKRREEIKSMSREAQKKAEAKEAKKLMKPKVGGWVGGWPVRDDEGRVPCLSVGALCDCD
jgi:hypothetical protein